MRRAILGFGILLLAAIPVRAQAQNDGEWTIIEETTDPTPAPQAQPQVSPSQGTLIVTVEQPPPGVGSVTVYLDDIAVGPAPWQGAAAPGAHSVRAEAPGWTSRKYRTKVTPGQSVAVSVALRQGGEADVGKWYLGLTYSFGAGGVHPDSGKLRLNCPGLGPGLNFGMRLPLDKIWLEAGIVVGPWTDRWIDYEPRSWDALSAADKLSVKERSGQGMPLALSLRFVSRILEPYLYWSATFEPGLLLYKPYKYSETDPQYGYVETLEDSGTRAIFTMSLRVGLAFFATDWFEIRVDPVGLGLHFAKPFGAVYTPSFALVLRL